MDNFSITQNGKPLDKSLYTIDLDNKVFFSKENELVLDFNSCNDYGWTFKTGYGCTFKTGSNCTFTTKGDCTFQTFDNCTFKTGVTCTFRTYDNCTFTTGGLCTFSVYNINTCKFKSYDRISSIILDRSVNKHYLLTKEFIDLQKIKNN